MAQTTRREARMCHFGVKKLKFNNLTYKKNVKKNYNGVYGEN